MLKESVEVEDEEIISSLKDLVKSKIASFAVPNIFIVRTLAPPPPPPPGYLCRG